MPVKFPEKSILSIPDFSNARLDIFVIFDGSFTYYNEPIN